MPFELLVKRKDGRSVFRFRRGFYLLTFRRDRRGDERRAAAEKEEEREARFFLQMHT
jgi:hypothetical protein